MSKPLARYRQLSPSASIKVSPLCLGSMTFGEAHSDKYGVCGKDESFKILDSYYDNGGNFIDTANAYRDGQSEEWLGEWMKLRKNRDDIVLATKFSSPYNFSPGGISINYSGNNLKSLRNSIETSLSRLQTSYIDLFYIHHWHFTTSIPELMQALNHLVVSGKVLYLGVSDSPAWVVAKANQYARDHGLKQFSVYQGMWSAVLRDFERDIIPMAIDEGMALCPYGTLNQGRFQTKENFKEREKTKEGRNFKPLTTRDKQVSAVLEELAMKRGDDTSLLNIALAYILQKAPYVFPIIGARKLEHLTGNFKALSINLTEEELEKIENAYPFEHGFPTNFLDGSMFDGSTSKMVIGPENNHFAQCGGKVDWVPSSKAISSQ